jgi:alanine dehydrogenase
MTTATNPGGRTMSTLILRQSDVRALLTPGLALQAVEEAFTAHGHGQAQMPAKVYLDFPETHGDLRAMPAAMAGSAGLKWICSNTDNPRVFGLPAVIGLYVLSNPANGLPIAILDATLLTAFRTGAAAALASRVLGPAEPQTLGIIGCGVQSDFLVEAHLEVFPGLRLLCADRDPAAAARLAAKYGGQVTSVEGSAGADLVCTATPGREWVVRRGWVAPHAHLNAIGADAHGKQELEPALTASARVFVDDLDQATHSGEVNLPIAKGELRVSDLAGTLGEALVGKVAARPTPGVPTVFDSTGLAIQDLALARLVVAEARIRGLGQSIDLLA